MASFLHRFADLLHDPPPDFVFEISEGGIAWARPGAAPAFQLLEEGVLQVSPLADNVLKPDAFADAVRRIAGHSVRKRRAVVILPDYSARIAVLGFDQFPSDPKDQASLVRFRMKKSVPFDVETAAVSYHAQGAKGPSDVVVAVAALEIVARYEAAFRAAGLHPGHVTTGAVTMAELVKAPDVSVIARRNGRLLTVVVMNGALLKLVRTVELASPDPEEILAVLFPTLAYIEDEMSTHPSRILFCGFDEGGRIPDWVSELQIPAERLQSRFGTPNGANAGLLGYLESMGAGVKGMRIPVNLASDPFRRDRPMIVASTVLAVLLTGLLGVLVYLAAAERDRAAEARTAIEKMQRQMDGFAREENRLQAVLRQPENAEVLDRSIFLNTLLQRKGVSWTKIFADLEQVTPHTVRLMSVRPQISADNQLTLDMWVASQSTEPVVSFVMQLEQSPLFGATTVSTSLPPSQNEPLYRYRVSVKYAQKL